MPRIDPQAPGRFGAVITYDLDLTRDSAVPVLGFSKPHPTPRQRRPNNATSQGSDRMMFDSTARAARARPGPCRRPTRARRHHPDFDRLATQGWKALEAEGQLSGAGLAQASSNGRSTWGCPAPTCLTDKSIPTFARGELPHFAGINTFLKAPYVENVRDVGKYDAAVIGIPFDSGTTYRPGTRFGPQGIRRISALYTPYNYELGVDLREQMTLCDAGDVFTIPANLEKSFDQITRGVAHVFSSGALPLMLGGDHSIGFPCVRGIAQCTSKRIGIIHFDRHIDIQEKDLDERMHTTPWYWATNLPNVPATNLVQLGIGGWQVPRDGVQEARKRGTNVLTIADIEKIGLEKTAEIALELAWKDADAVYISFDVDSIDCGFVPGTGWPEPGGFLPREALKLLGLVAAEGICGLEVVEVSPPYDTSDITALVGVRVVVEVLGSLVAHGKLGAHKALIDKPVSLLRHGHASTDTTTITIHHNGTAAAHGITLPASATTTPTGRAGVAQWQTPHLGRGQHARRTSTASPISIWSRRPSSRASRPPPTRPASCAWRTCRSRRRRPTARSSCCCASRPRSSTDIGSITPHLGGAIVPLRSAAGGDGDAPPAPALHLS